MFRKHAITPVFEKQRIDSFCFDVVVHPVALRLGFEIHDRPVRSQDATGTKLRVVQDSPELVDLIRRCAARGRGSGAR